MLAGVVGVQDLRDGLGVRAELRGLGVVAGVEGVQVEVLVGGLGAPQAQAVHGLSAVAHDGHVIGHGLHELAALLREPIAARLVLVAHDLAAEAHEHGVLRLPRVALVEPVVRDLHLAAVDDLLLEQAVVVAHAVAKSQDTLGGHGVQEARGQTSQASVAQARVALLGDELLKVDVHLGQALLHDVSDAVVEQVVVEQRAQEELEAEVVDLLLVALLVLGVRRGELAVGLAGDELGKRLVLVLRRAVPEVLADERLERRSVLVGKCLGVLEDVVDHSHSSLWSCGG